MDLMMEIDLDVVAPSSPCYGCVSAACRTCICADERRKPDALDFCVSMQRSRDQQKSKPQEKRSKGTKYKRQAEISPMAMTKNPEQVVSLPKGVFGAIGNGLLLFGRFSCGATNEALNGRYGVFGVGNRLILSGLAHHAFAVFAETHHGRSGAVAFGINQNFWFGPFHDRHGGIGGAQVDTNNLCHFLYFLSACAAEALLQHFCYYLYYCSYCSCYYRSCCACRSYLLRKGKPAAREGGENRAGRLSCYVHNIKCECVLVKFYKGEL